VIAWPAGHGLEAIPPPEYAASGLVMPPAGRLHAACRRGQPAPLYTGIHRTLRQEGKQKEKLSASVPTNGRVMFQTS